MSDAERREYPVRPFIGVLAVVRRGNQFLLIERGKPPNQGRWGFPGGVQELGETVSEAAIRELAEETGIIADSPRILPPIDHIDRDEAGKVRYQFLLVPALLEWRRGEGEPSEEALALGWFDLNSIAHLDALPRVKDILASIDG